MPDHLRHASSIAVATVFPRGQLMRNTIARVFRLAQPYYFLRTLFIFLWSLVFSCCLKNKVKKK
jgi:hypothetical protein